MLTEVRSVAACSAIYKQLMAAKYSGFPDNELAQSLSIGLGKSSIILGVILGAVGDWEAVKRNSPYSPEDTRACLEQIALEFDF